MIESQTFRVWNTTRDSLLCAEITVADAGHEELDQLIQAIVIRPGAGLWLRPCLGAPVATGAPPFDMVCIDQDCRVVEQYESFLSGTFVLFQPRTTGALILPARTIAASRTKVGDSLDIMLPEEDSQEQLPTAGTAHKVSRDEEAAVSEGGREGVVSEQSISSLANEHSESDAPAVASEFDEEEVETKKKDSIAVKFLRWLVPDRRKEERRASPKLTAHRWSGDQMHTYVVEDVSSTGIYVVTDERPFRGTVFMLTLRKKARQGQGDGEAITVQSKVVRWGESGLGLEFITADGVSSKDATGGLEGGASSIQLRRFLQSI